MVPGDDFFAFIGEGYIAPWTREADRQNEIVVGAAAAAAGRLAAGGYTVVYDGVIGPWFLDAFVAATGLAAVHYVVLRPPDGSAWSGYAPVSLTASPISTRPATCTVSSPAMRSAPAGC